MVTRVMDGWVHVMDGIVGHISYRLGLLAHFSTRRSKTVLAVWLACILLCFIGVLRFNNVNDTNKLWIDVEGVGAQHEALVQSHFNTSSSYALLFIAESKTQPGSDVITLADLTELFEMKDAMFAIQTPTRGQDLTSLCLRRPDDVSRCIITGVMNFWNTNTTSFLSESLVDDDVKTTMANPVYPDGSKVSREMELSQFEIVSGKASAVGFSYILLLKSPENSQEQGDINEFVHLTELLSKDPRWTRLKFSFAYDTAVDDALSSTVGKDIVLMIIAYVLMIVFTQVMLGRPFSLLEGRALLGFEAVLLVVFATVGAFGLSMAFGMPFTTLQEVLPFLLVGVGIDNAFVVLSALDRIPRKLPLETRAQMAMQRVGMNITITSFVDIVALLFALISKLPAVRYFGVYAAMSILFIYLSFISAFIALVAIDERRREHGRMDCIVCASTRPASQHRYANSEKKDTAMDKVDQFFIRTYAPFLLSRPIRLLVLAIFGALSGYMIYATLRLGTDFHVSDLAPQDAAVYDYIKTHERLFHGLSFPANSMGLFFTDVNYTSGDVQRSIREAVTSTLQLDSIQSNAPPSDWHAAFTTWATNTAPFDSFPRDSTNSFLVGDGFYQALQTFLSIPEAYYLFSDKVILENGVIVISRIVFTTQYLSSADQQINALEEMKQAASQSSLYPDVFYHSGDESFWEQKGFMRTEATDLFSLTIVSVAIICAFGLVHPVSVLIMVVTLGMIFVDLLGTLALLGIDLNSISVVNLVMAVGLVVDATVHVVRSFGIQRRDLSRKEKATLALGELGTPIFLGACTIILGVLPLAGASSEVFRVFFKCFLAIVILGWSHGLIFLPVVLSFIGPNIGIPPSEAVVDNYANSADLNGNLAVSAKEKDAEAI